jgi:hypothetical protein
LTWNAEHPEDRRITADMTAIEAVGTARHCLGPATAVGDNLISKLVDF